MSSPRIITAILVCAGVLAFGPQPAAGQQARTAPPQAPGATAATTKPAPAARTARPIVVDPMFDVTLIVIREKVTFDEEQWAALLERYRVLRVEQREVIHVIKAEAVRKRAEERAKRSGAAGSGASGTGGHPAAKATAGDLGAAMNIEEKLKPLNERFVADVRGIIDESQHEAWDACADGLDLTTQPRYFGLRPEMRWRDPALGPEVGEMAPDFTLDSTGGEKVTLSSFRGAPVALLFGSTSSPSFRRAVEQTEMLQRAYREKVRWIIVYTFEAHPTGGRVLKVNKSDGVEIPQHKSYEERLALAQKVHDEKTPSCRVLADDFKDTVTKQYFGYPNRFYLIDGEGRVILKQVRFDEQAATVTLYEVLTGRSAETP